MKFKTIILSLLVLILLFVPTLAFADEVETPADTVEIESTTEKTTTNGEFAYSTAIFIEDVNATTAIVVAYADATPNMMFSSPSGKDYPVNSEKYEGSNMSYTMESAASQLTINFKTSESGKWLLKCNKPVSITSRTLDDTSVQEPTKEPAKEPTEEPTTKNEKETTPAKEEVKTEDAADLNNIMTLFKKYTPIALIGAAVIGGVIVFIMFKKHKKNAKQNRIQQISSINEKENKEFYDEINKQQENVKRPTIYERSVRLEQAEKEDEIYNKKENYSSNINTPETYSNLNENYNQNNSDAHEYGYNEPVATGFNDEGDEFAKIKAQADAMWAKYESQFESSKQEKETKQPDYMDYEYSREYELTHEDIENDITIEEYNEEMDDSSSNKDTQYVTKKRSFFPEDRFGD